MTPEKHAWKTKEYPSLGIVTSCACGAVRRSKKDDDKLCRRTERRRALKTCEKCFFPSVSGAAFTGYICNSCHQEKMWSNTRIPVICPECADAGGLCVRCGHSREPGAIVK